MASLVVRSVAWNGDGRALAATDRGLAFWDGTEWAEVSTRGYTNPSGIHFIRRLPAGQWLLGGEAATIARFDGTKIVDMIEGPEKHLIARHASGELDDLAVFCFDEPNGRPTLYCICGGRWLQPLVLDDVDVVTSIARVADEAWLVSGRAADGFGYLAIYRPLRFRIDRLPLDQTRTLLAVAGDPTREVGVGCGVDGRIAWVEKGVVGAKSKLREPRPLSLAAFDPTGRVWFASLGAIWTAAAPGTEQLAWAEPSFQSPFASLSANDGALFAMTVDGAVVEGRQERG